jgi:YidC/Oxa1 family membrane protein insertase
MIPSNNMLEIWNTALYYPLLNLLVWLYRLTGSFGWAVVFLTVGLGAATTPLVWSSIKAMKKQQELAPELAKLKEEYKDKKQELLAAQTELYKKSGINPASGCLPRILQILVLIALFNAFNLVLNTPSGEIVSKLNPLLYANNKLSPGDEISVWFYNINLVKPDLISIPGSKFGLPGIIVLLAALVQFLSSKMMMPETSVKADPDDVMATTSEQMLYLFPVMTIFFAYQFPAGLVLYWLVLSLVSAVQQYFASGFGGLTPWIKRLGLIK